VGGGLVAAGIVGTLADLKIQAAMRHSEAAKETAADEVRLHIEGRAHETLGPATPRSPSLIATTMGIHGSLLDGSMDISYVGSAQDSAVFATLSAPGEASLDLDAQSRGMVISTAVGEIELLEPGQYTIALQSDSVGYVTVAKGLARVDDHSIGAHGVATARSGEVIKMRKGQMPTRNMRER